MNIIFPKEIINIIINYKEEIEISEKKKKVLDKLIQKVKDRNRYIFYNYKHIMSSHLVINGIDASFDYSFLDLTFLYYNDY